MSYRILPESRSESRYAALFIAAGVAATLAIWRQTEWETLIAKAVLLLLCAVVANHERHLCTAGDWKGALAVATVAMLVCMGLWQGLSVSAVPYRSGRSALDWMSASAALWAMWRLCRRKEVAERVLTITAVFGVLLCVMATLQFFTSEGRIFWVWKAAEPQVFGPFQSRNNYASFALLIFPLATWKGLQRTTNWHFLVAGASIGASIVASGSRAGVLLFAFELVFLSWWYGKDLRNSRAMVGTGILLTVAIAIAGWSQLENKLLDADPFRYRREMIRTAIRMIQEKPLTGFGLGTFPSVYPAFAEFDSGHYVNHAHNDWAELGAEGGIPAMVLLGIFVSCVLHSVLRNPWGLGVPLVFVHSLVDYPLQRIGLLFWVLVLSAVLLATNPKLKTRSGAQT